MNKEEFGKTNPEIKLHLRLVLGNGKALTAKFASQAPFQRQRPFTGNGFLLRHQVVTQFLTEV